MADEAQEKEAADATPRRNVARVVVRIGVVVFLGALVTSTIYLAVITVKWRHHVQELVDATSDLAELVASHEQSLGAASVHLNSIDDGLHSQIDAVIATANDKAQAQDLDYLFRDYAIAMADCVVETQIATRSIADLRDFRWQPAWQRAVGEYCDEIEADLRDLIAGPEEGGE